MTRDPLGWIEETLRVRAARVFLETAAGRVVLYGELERESRRMAAALRSLGVSAGDRITVQVDKSPEAVFLYIACLRLGAVFMPLNTAYTAVELDYFVGDAAPKVVIASPGATATAARLCQTSGSVEVLTVDGAGPCTFNALAAGMTAASLASASWASPLGGEAIAALVYTSGTTGRSKGAMLTRSNLAANSTRLIEAWAFTEEDVLLHALPIFHVHGLFMAIDTVLASGASLLFLERFDPEEVLRVLPRVSVMMGVPTYYIRLLQNPALTRAATAALRLFICGSAPLLPQTHQAFEACTGHSILERYGMTETLINTSNPYQGDRRAGSVGPALAGVELRITDLDTGEITSIPKSIGSIEVRGPNVFKGYWQATEKTQSSFRRDGFFITGDLGYLDVDGYLYIVGRGKDLIISGGFNVYPVEIEEAINALPEVAESAVIGVPHADLGEGVTAIVVANAASTPSEHGIIEALKLRLAKFKIPKRVLFVGELPRNAMGKVQKQLLRTLHAKLYD